MRPSDASSAQWGGGIDASLAADARMVASVRLVLSASALMAAFVDTHGWRAQPGTVGLVFGGYVLHSLAIFVGTQLGQPQFRSRAIHWLDVFWFTLIVLVTDGVHSFFFLFYFFAILSASFQWGQDEGARVTLACVCAFAASGLGMVAQGDFPWLLMRAAFLLALGRMVAHWGECKVDLRRRMALLHEVGRLSNPRFGVAHTLGCVMDKTLGYFQGDSCLLLIRDRDTGECLLRTLHAGEVRRLVPVETIDTEAARPLLALPKGRLVLHNRPQWPWLQVDAAAGGAAWDESGECWVPQSFAGLADLLNAPSFISAPLSMRQGEGRILVLSRHRRYRRSEAHFLGCIAAQVFPVIENIEVLDHMASDAAHKERQRIALDLHDTAIQPYIGLKMGLSALRNKADAGNPLREDIDRMLQMADQVIGELRRYAGAVRHGPGQARQVILPELRQQAAQVHGLYGIDIDVQVDGEIEADDRLIAEVLQLVREGVCNICKHTDAQSGLVRVGCTNGWLRIQIENENRSGEVPVPGFQPRSITERATALGGSAQVTRGADGRTVLLVEIPV